MKEITTSEQYNPKIETIKGPNKNEVALSPERGGIITSMKLRDTEVLYLDPNNFYNQEQKVRGGIPNLYPNSGPMREDSQYNLKQHGYGRMSDKWEKEESEGELIEVLQTLDERLSEVV